MMKNFAFLLTTLIGTLILNACSPILIASSSGQQSTPIIETAPATSYQPVQVDPVQAEVGVGSPITAGWTTHTSQKCEYAISYPTEMLAHAQNPYSDTIIFNLANPEEGARNFIYLSVITSEIQSMVKQGVYFHDVYNYDPMETEILLNMQVGESKAVRDIPNIDVAPSFTYQRQPDTMISGYAAQTYENMQPWEYPIGTKEIRYYLSQNGCTYLIGGYMDTTGSNQPGAITEELFQQIVATIRLTP